MGGRSAAADPPLDAGCSPRRGYSGRSGGEPSAAQTLASSTPAPQAQARRLGVCRGSTRPCLTCSCPPSAPTLPRQARQLPALDAVGAEWLAELGQDRSGRPHTCRSGTASHPPPTVRWSTHKTRNATPFAPQPSRQLPPSHPPAGPVGSSTDNAPGWQP